MAVEVGGVIRGAQQLLQHEGSWFCKDYKCVLANSLILGQRDPCQCQRMGILPSRSII